LLLGIGVLLVEAYSLARVGMWMGLRCRTAARAMTATLGWVFGPTWGAAALFLILMTTGGISGSDEVFYTFAVVWALGSMGYSGWLGRHAARCSSRDFTSLVAGLPPGRRRVQSAVSPCFWSDREDSAEAGRLLRRGGG